MIKLNLIIIVICTCFSTIYCDSVIARDKHDKHDKHHHHHDLLWKSGIFWYYTFLAFKVKAVFVAATVFAIGLFIGKAFAVIKFAEYMKGKEHTHHDFHPEKIIYSDPHSDHGAYHGSADSLGPPGDFETAGSSKHHVYQSYPPGYYSVTAPPGFLGNNIGNNNYNNPGSTAPYTMKERWGQTGGRSMDNTGIYEYFEQFLDIIRNSNITEMAFDKMGIKSPECKETFLCQIEYNTKRSVVMKYAFNVLSDKSYLKYKPKNDIKSLQDCQEVYDKCRRSILD